MTDAQRADLNEPIVQLTAMLGNLSAYPDAKIKTYQALHQHSDTAETRSDADIEYRGRKFHVTTFVTDVGATDD